MKKQKISFAFNICIFLLIFMFPSLIPVQISFIHHTIHRNFPWANSFHAADVDNESLINVLEQHPLLVIFHGGKIMAH